MLCGFSTAFGTLGTLGKFGQLCVWKTVASLQELSVAMMLLRTLRPQSSPRISLIAFSHRQGAISLGTSLYNLKGQGSRKTKARRRQTLDRATL